MVMPLDSELHATLEWIEEAGEAHVNLNFNENAKPVVLEIIYSGCGHSYWCVVRKKNDSYSLGC